MTAHRAAMRISKLTFHPFSVYKSCSSMRRLRQSHWARVVYFVTSYANKFADRGGNNCLVVHECCAPVVLSAK
jgi:hypothetical protein